MKWATRSGVHIDRAACAWLIRRHVDSDAQFVFVADPADVPADATPFDMRGGRSWPSRGDCTFETILRRYQLVDPVLWKIAEIEHEADLADELVRRPRSSRARCGAARAVDGVHRRRRPHPHHTLFDGLHEFYRRATLLGRAPA